MAESTQIVKLRKGASSQIFYVELRDSTVTTGALSTALAFGGLTADKIEWGVDAAVVSLTPQDIAALGTWVSPTANTNIRFKETAGLSGLYEVQIHDDWIDAEGRITLVLQGANTMPKRVDIVVEDTAKEDSVQAIQTLGATLNQFASGRTLTGGTTEVGTYTNTENDDALYHEINDNAGLADVYYDFDIGPTSVPSSVSWKGYGLGTNDDWDVQAYNWGGTSWDTIGNIQGLGPVVPPDWVQQFVLFPKHVDTTPGATEGFVRIRFYKAAGLTSSELQTNQLTVQYAVSPEASASAGYADGAIWVDTLGGTAGTTDYFNGTADNPVLTWADALTLSASIGLTRFHIINGSTITLSANSDNYTLLGENWTLVLNGQSCVNASFTGASVSGTCTGSGLEFHRCLLNTTTTTGDGFFIQCGMSGDFVCAVAGTYYFDNCFSGVAGTATPSIDFGAGVANTNVNFRHYSGGIEVKNIGANGTDNMSLEGHGQIVLNANCAGGTIAIRGHFTVTDNVVGGFVAGGGVISDDARYTMSEQAIASADDVWDEDIVAAHGTVDTAGLLLRALGADISQRTNNLTLNDLLGVPDTAATDTLAGQVWEETYAGHTSVGSMGEVMNSLVTAGFPTVVAIADGVWDEDIVAAHGTGDTAGLLLRALGALISQRSNNATLHGLLGIPDVQNVNASPYALAATATGVTANNIIEDTVNLTQTDADYWNGSWCLMLSGNAAGQIRRILDFAPATDEITVFPAFTTAGGLAAGDEYAILRSGSAFMILDSAASAAVTDEIWDELTAGHAIANSAGERLQALDTLLEVGGTGDATEIFDQCQKLDKAGLLAVGDPGYDADSVAGDLNSLISTVALIDRDILCSVNLEGATLRIEVGSEQYGVVVTGTYTQASCQIFDESNGIVATIGVGDFGAVTSRGFWQYDLNPHGLVAGHTYQIQVLLSDGVGGTYQNTKLFKVVNV